MITRALALLRTTSNRESARTDLAMARAVFLIIGCLVLLPAATTGGGFARIGPVMLQALFAPSVFLMVFLAVRLGGDSVGDVRCGLLELLFLSDTTPAQWLLVRAAQMWISFAAVWMFRAPLLFIVHSLGGVRVETFLVSELLLITGFMFLSSLSLLVSFTAKSRRQVFGFVIGGLLIWEFLLMAPRIAAELLSRYYSWSVPLEVISATRQMESVGLVSCYRFAITRPMLLMDCWPTIALYAGLSGLILAWFRRCAALYAAGSNSDPARAENVPDPVRQRASRRCWDDALAWQAFTIHGGGPALVLGKCISYPLLGLLMLFLAVRGFHDVAFIISVAATAAMMFLSMNKAGDCLSREIRERTITMLLLTPNGPDEFYAGWQRGAWRLAWPDLLLGAGVTLASFLVTPAAPPVLIATGAAILSSSPFLMLSPLVPFSVSGIATGVLLIMALIVILVVCIWLGVEVSPVAVPVVSIPAAVIYNQVLRRSLLSYWMKQKLSSIV